MLSTFLVLTAIERQFCVKNRMLFGEIDPNIVYIPEEVRQLCGFRYIPYQRQIKFSEKCFGFNFVKNVTERDKPKQKHIQHWPRIQNGVNAEMNESPWTVQIARYEKGFIFTDDEYHYRCTGVLITLKHILTAAHCHRLASLKNFLKFLSKPGKRSITLLIYPPNIPVFFEFNDLQIVGGGEGV